MAVHTNITLGAGKRHLVHIAYPTRLQILELQPWMLAKLIYSITMHTLLSNVTMQKKPWLVYARAKLKVAILQLGYLFNVEKLLM